MKSAVERMLLIALLILSTLAVSLQAENTGLQTFRDARSGRVIFIKNTDVAAAKTLAALTSSREEQTPSVPRAYYLADGWQTYEVPGVGLNLAESTEGDDRYVSAPDGFIPNTLTLSNSFINEHGKIFGLTNPGSELIPYAIKDDGKGMLHINYYQQYKSVPVFGSEIIVHVGSDKEVHSANGRAVTDIDLDETPSLTEEEAIAAAKAFYHRKFTTPEPQVMKTKLWVFNPGLVENKEDSTSYLVYEVTLHNLKPKVNEQFFINAKTGELVFQLTGIRKDNPNSVDRYVFDCSMNLLFGGGSGCGLDDYISLKSYTFGCTEGLCPRGLNPMNPPHSGTTDVDDLYSTLGHIHDYLWLKFQRSGGNGRGGIGDDQTHGNRFVPFSRTTAWAYLDALGNDCDPVAGFNHYSVWFCIGTIVTDLVAHEYGHSLTHFHSFNPDNTWNIITYYDESGALTENYSDVLGEGVENYIHGSNDWIFVNDPDLGQYRNLADPATLSYDPDDGPARPQPDRYNSPNVYCGEWDNGGLHVNANVLNKGAYLVAMGGIFNGCNITGLGMEKMQQIWYHAMEYYYTINANFNDAYYALNQACTDLEQSGIVAPGECKQVEKALQAVEIDQAGFCSGIPGHPPACASDPNCMAANLDGIPPVNMNDLAVMASGWLMTQPGDIDQSGQVNLTDLQILAHHWLSDCTNTKSQPMQKSASADISIPTSPEKAKTLEVFVMSLCPYAKQTEAAVLDYLGSLDATVRPRLDIRYLFGRRRNEQGLTYTSLHGEPEIHENLVQVLLRDAFGPELLHAYLRLRAASDAPWDELTTQIGLTEEDNQFIYDTIKNDRETLIAAEYDAMLTDHGRLTRSPTFIWQGHRLQSLQEAPPFEDVRLTYTAGCH